MLPRLKKLRLEKNITQQELADVLNVSQQSINKYENHSTEPSIETLTMIADFFDTSIDYIVGRIKEKEALGSILYTLSEDEEAFFRYYRRLSKEKRNCVDNLIRLLNS